jgi:hypothetical protein
MSLAIADQHMLRSIVEIKVDLQTIVGVAAAERQRALHLTASSRTASRQS